MDLFTAVKIFIIFIPLQIDPLVFLARRWAGALVFCDLSQTTALAVVLVIRDLRVGALLAAHRHQLVFVVPVHQGQVGHGGYVALIRIVGIGVHAAVAALKLVVRAAVLVVPGIGACRSLVTEFGDVAGLIVGIVLGVVLHRHVVVLVVLMEKGGVVILICFRAPPS
jgi:hypothetical protein